jgi:hypothetical protein
VDTVGQATTVLWERAVDSDTLVERVYWAMQIALRQEIGKADKSQVQNF